MPNLTRRAGFSGVAGHGVKTPPAEQLGNRVEHRLGSLDGAVRGCRLCLIYPVRALTKTSVEQGVNQVVDLDRIVLINLLLAVGCFGVVFRFPLGVETVPHLAVDGVESL